MTVQHTLSVIVFHILENKEILANLQRELKKEVPYPDSKPKWDLLEQLPYLVSLS